MLITSFEFLVFFIVSLLVYYVMPARCRWCVLLVFSIFYYVRCAVPYTIIYLLISVVSIFLASNYFERLRRETKTNTVDMPKQAKMVLVSAIVLNVGLLAALKYTNFMISNVNAVAVCFGRGKVLSHVDWIASLGISYYTLQMIGYLCDSYWGGLFQKRIYLS